MSRSNAFLPLLVNLKSAERNYRGFRGVMQSKAKAATISVCPKLHSYSTRENCIGNGSRAGSVNYQL